MSDLLQQAIADAKAIRDAAIENAKATLAESFAPQIKNMIRTRLMEVDDLAEDEEPILDAYMPDEEENKMEEVNLDSIMEELEGEMHYEGMSTEHEDEDEKAPEMKEEYEEDLEETYRRYDEDVALLEEILDELNEETLNEDMADMDEALNALEEELKGLDMYKESSNYDLNEEFLFEEDDMPEEDMEMSGEEGMGMSADPLAGMTEEDVEELSKGELRDLVLSLLHGGDQASGVEDLDMDMEGELPSEDDIKEAVESVLDEMSYGDYLQLEESVLGPINRKPGIQRQPTISSRNSGRQLSEGAEVQSLRKKLQESYKTVHTLQTTLNEVALINSKLLFTGKLFRTYNSLSEKQKVTILEYFDRVDSEDDVKKLYNKFTTVLNRKQGQTATKLTESNQRTRLTESTASRTAGPSTKPQTNIVEDAVITRWQELAGIIK